MLKNTIIFSLVLSLGIIGLSFAATDDAFITNLGFAQLLVNTLNIQLPVGTEQLSSEEQFQVLANILAEKGINNFLGLNANDNLTYGNMAGALYAALGGKENLSAAEKIQYLVNNGYLSSAQEPTANVPASQVQEVMNNPAFTTAVAEAYATPADIGVAAAVAEAGTDAPGATREEPASQI